MSVYQQITFSDSDILNLDDWIPKGEYNPHNVRPWLLHDHGFVVAVVFADCLQNAIDEAVDENKMERYLIAPENYSDYGKTENEQWDNMTCLGNAGEPHDIETLGAIKLPNPPRSFCSQFDAAFKGGNA